MEYSFAVDAEFLRVKVSGLDTDRPPSELEGKHLDRTRAHPHRARPQMANQFIDVVAANRDLMVRNFPDVEVAKGWLRTRPA